MDLLGGVRQVFVEFSIILITDRIARKSRQKCRCFISQKVRLVQTLFSGDEVGRSIVAEGVALKCLLGIDLRR